MLRTVYGADPPRLISAPEIRCSKADFNEYRHSAGVCRNHIPPAGAIIRTLAAGPIKLEVRTVHAEINENNKIKKANRKLREEGTTGQTAGDLKASSFSQSDPRAIVSKLTV